MKYTIKIMLLIFAASTVFFSACNKTNFSLDDQKKAEKIESFKHKAIEFSVAHNLLATKIIVAEEVAQSDKKEHLTNDEFFEVIKNVTGTKPEPVSFEKGTDSLPALRMDVEQIRLEDYSKTSFSKRYFASIDAILQTEPVSLEDLLQQIDDVQRNMESNRELNLQEMEQLITFTETLKGSLQMWDEQLVDTQSLKNNWPRWKKLAFIAAADAFGATIGFFVGSYFVVWGVPLYLPPGPAGAVGGAAIFSTVAYQYVY